MTLISLILPWCPDSYPDSVERFSLSSAYIAAILLMASENLINAKCPYEAIEVDALVTTCSKRGGATCASYLVEDMYYGDI